MTVGYLYLSAFLVLAAAAVIGTIWSLGSFVAWILGV